MHQIQIHHLVFEVLLLGVNLINCHLHLARENVVQKVVVQAFLLAELVGADYADLSVFLET